jgi:RES domain-containing protein
MAAMAALPGALGDGRIAAFRLDTAHHARTWDSGEGARLLGGRWNSVGQPAVYCAFDPATAILEVAVHKGFETLDRVTHVMTRLHVAAAQDVYVVEPKTIPNASWLRPCQPSRGQQRFGDALLSAHRFIVIPSAVSTQSWNLIFNPQKAASAYAMLAQDAFALDTRLHPPAR